MKIGAKVRIAREAKRYSQEKIADLLNISQSKYCRFENNKTFIDWNSLPLLAKTLDLDINDLFPIKTLYVPLENNHLTKIEEHFIKIIKEKDEYYNNIINEKDKIIKSLLK